MMFVAYWSTKSNSVLDELWQLHVNNPICSRYSLITVTYGQNVCVKVYFIGWPEEFLGDGKNNENHHGPYHFTTA